MQSKNLPDYADFDDHVYTQRIAVVVRWFLIALWLAQHNYRPDLSDDSFFINNALAVTLGLLNGYVHWRILKGRPITSRYVLALSIADVSGITLGIGVTDPFANNFFILYYPALMVLSLVFSSRRLSFGITTLVAATYAGMSITMRPGLDFDGDERILIMRIATMFAVVAAGNLIARIERNRRREAVEAERVLAARNVELQRVARDAEVAGQEEWSRIARDIHDGISQSIYSLTLSLEACADLAEQERGPLNDRLQNLVPLAKKTLMESRPYIHDLRPILEEERDLVAMTEIQVKEFQMVAGTPAHLSVDGEPGETPVAVSMCLYRILQEALANVMKHARASSVDVGLGFEPGSVRLSVRDDGVGFETDGQNTGYGLGNMRQRAKELDGSFELSSVPGKGTGVTVALPTLGGIKWTASRS